MKGSVQNSHMQRIMVQQASPGSGSDRYRNKLIDCDRSGPARCVKTKFRARLSSERSDFAASGMNQSMIRRNKSKIHIWPQSSVALAEGAYRGHFNYPFRAGPSY